MNDTINKLRRNFATGMTSARISDDEWRDVFLPVIRDAERLNTLIRLLPSGTFCDFDVDSPESWRTAIDAAMSATTEESK